MVLLATESASEDPSLGKTFGALLMGTFFALMLYGLLVHQSSHYFRRFAKDTRINKTFVMSLLYMYLITYAFDQEARRLAIWSLQWYPLITVSALPFAPPTYTRRGVPHPVESFRAFVSASRNVFTPAGCISVNGPIDHAIQPWGILILYRHSQRKVPRTRRLGGRPVRSHSRVDNLAATVIACMAKQLERFVPDIWIDTASYASTVASDAITTGVLVFNLKRYRTGIERTDALLDRLASYSINTGMAAHRHREYAPTHPLSLWKEGPGRVPGVEHPFHQSICELSPDGVCIVLAVSSLSQYIHDHTTFLYVQCNCSLNSRNALVDASNAVSTHLDSPRMAIPVPATRVPQDDHSGRGLLSPVAGMEGEGRSFSDRLISGDL
ncbi:hypothetical protein NUW54_g8934 [Trametes sanguinea]|uniref:Uncharacterized protein n=1 Tax=Trametes sanguinea TaxID=158606 RepID=A0ACC1P9Q8_9APHY|nr:hypothetical protein NUW54_g8934 [Trametes sanguinea]